MANRPWLQTQHKCCTVHHPSASLCMLWAQHRRGTVREKPRCHAASAWMLYRAGANIVTSALKRSWIPVKNSSNMIAATMSLRIADPGCDNKGTTGARSSPEGKQRLAGLSCSCHPPCVSLPAGCKPEQCTAGLAAHEGSACTHGRTRQEPESDLSAAEPNNLSAQHRRPSKGKLKYTMSFSQPMHSKCTLLIYSDADPSQLSFLTRLSFYK